MFKLKLYRKCKCGETVHHAKWHRDASAPGGGTWTWNCRNCGAPARDRSGGVKVMTEHDRPGSSERGPG